MRLPLPKSFGGKLALGFMTVALVAIAVVITPMTLAGKRDANQQLRAKAMRYARFIEPQLRTVVAFDDTLTAREVFAPFAADKDVAGIAVYTATGVLIEGYGKHPSSIVRGQKVASPGNGRLLVISPVVSREGPVGTLAVVLSTESIATIVRRSATLAAIWACAALALAASIALLFARSVSVRLTRIATAANKVADGDLEQPDILAGGDDEIGHLVHAFNVMVEKLRRQFAERKQLAETDQARLEALVGTRTAQLEESREQYRLIAESTNAIPFTYLPTRRVFAYIGPQALKVFGHPLENWSVPGFFESLLPPEEVPVVLAHIQGASSGEASFECSALGASAATRQLRWVATRGELRGEPCVRGLMLDITQQRKLESDLQQGQKLESVGRLASGVAHEINTPVQFVSDNVHFLRAATADLIVLIAALKQSSAAVLEGKPSLEAAEAAAVAEQKADLTYLVDEMPKAFAGCTDGLKRVATIVRSMKEFAHPDSTEMSSVDLNRAIESTIVIASNEYKYVADVETRLDPIPHVMCYAGDVNQAVLNIIVNAAHAIHDVVGDGGAKGKIVVSTREDGDDYVVISIQDTGGGIPEHVRARIFDPFFTTKGVGKGTGQGLSIARSVIVEKHGGDLTLETEVGVGTTFHLRLPIQGKSARTDTPEASAVAA